MDIKVVPIRPVIVLVGARRGVYLRRLMDILIFEERTTLMAGRDGAATSKDFSVREWVMQVKTCQLMEENIRMLLVDSHKVTLVLDRIDNLPPIAKLPEYAARASALTFHLILGMESKEAFRTTYGPDADLILEKADIREYL